ncbi:MAG TPA: hypothetical protein VFQ43_16665 [Nitrososphaera sp.]|nr:hypothetical protein [Nitrososphaera sp.]
MVRTHRQGLWEYQWAHITGELVLLPPDQWRYFVLTFPILEERFPPLEYVLDLAPVELEVGFKFFQWDAITKGFSVQPSRVFQVLQGGAFDDQEFFIQVTRRDIDVIARLLRQLQSHDEKLIPLQPLLNQLYQLKTLPFHSPLRFLGYFGLLESLLTHAPKPDDRYDSITRQVKTKLALLENRWSSRLDYSAFNETRPGKIWTKMYSCRSQIAHGTAPNFDRGEMAALKSYKHAFQERILGHTHLHNQKSRTNSRTSREQNTPEHPKTA